MIFVLDTNVLSEGLKASPDKNVTEFVRALPVENVRVCAVVLGEIAMGVELNPTPDLKAFLAEVLALPLAEFGEAEALEWGKRTSAALQSGAALNLRDTFIAATASVRGWTVATRNTPDFAPMGVQTFNPWTDKL